MRLVLHIRRIAIKGKSKAKAYAVIYSLVVTNSRFQLCRTLGFTL